MAKLYTSGLLRGNKMVVGFVLESEQENYYESMVVIHPNPSNITVELLAVLTALRFIRSQNKEVEVLYSNMAYLINAFREDSLIDNWLENNQGGYDSLDIKEINIIESIYNLATGSICFINTDGISNHFVKLADKLAEKRMNEIT